MSTNLMIDRRFAPLFWTQFLSAFNDNFLKNTLVFLVLFTLPVEQAAPLVTVAGAVFMAPFLLLSALGGQIADKFDKAMVTRRLKLFEIGAATAAVLGLAVSSVAVLLAALFAFGAIAALFGPIKYGILPDHLEKQDLPRANAWLEGATFAAILGGTIVGGLASTGGVDVWVFGPLMMVLALGCWLASRAVPATGAADPDLRLDPNILRSTWTLLGEIRADTRIWRSSLMISWFWLLGAVMLSLLPTLVKDHLGGDEHQVTAFLAVFAIAIGVGSAIAAWLCTGRIVLLPAPVGTVLLALFALDLAFAISGSGPAGGGAILRAAVDLAGFAVAGAFLVVPTFAAIQTWSPTASRARVIAAVNVLNAAFMTAGGVMVALAQTLGVTIAQLLAGLALFSLAAAWLMLKYLPTNPFRDLVSVIFRAFHRLEVEGLENIAKAGRAPILALNHVSFLDGALALALTDEEPVFAIDHTIAHARWVKPFLKVTRALPLNPAKPMSTRALIKAAQGGDPVVIFPEGRITVTGSLMKVYDGAAMVADKTGSMVVPIRIDGLERSFFSRLASWQVRRSLFPKVKVTILEPQRLSIPPGLTGRHRRAAAGTALYRIMSELVFRTTPVDRTIFEQVAAGARARGAGALAVQDPLTGSLSYGKLLTGAAVLGGRLKAMYPDEATLGVMLPNANGTCVTLLAAMSAGKVPAMINFTAGSTNILSACKAAQVKTILTSRAFVEQAKLNTVVDEVGKEVAFAWLDDIRQSVGLLDKLAGTLRRWKPLVHRNADDPAVILFTSGSEGTPKGVVLTHRNILANAAQAAARIDFHAGDKVFNLLPVFHSFGLTAGTILPLISGTPVYFYPSPLHYRLVPELIYSSNATIVFGTDTFLAGYARTAHAYDFRSVRYCFAGAEPVKASTRETYMNKFGLRILEGYGVTEAAPVIAINTPMYNKAGTVGRIMPGMEHRLEPVAGVDTGGRLLVRGPNIMAGYLRAENPGVLQPPPDGWHDTGDIVTVDADGFIAIRGRAKRFAKIAGEMVSLAAVEALAADLWSGALSAAVTLPDPRKGERLVLVTEAAAATRAEFMTYAKGRGAQDLMVPAELRVVSRMPVLGTGKIDFVAVRALAAAAAGNTQAA